MMPTRSDSCAASSRSCLVRTIVTPLSRSSRIRSHRNSRAAGSRPVEGSSRKRTSGECIGTRDHRPLHLAGQGGRRHVRRGRIGGADRSLARLAHACELRDTRVEEQILPDRHPTFEVVALRNDGEVPNRALTGSATTSIPATSALPSVGRTPVVRIPIVGVFPAPFGPRRPTPRRAAPRTKCRPQPPRRSWGSASRVPRPQRATRERR